MGQIKADEEWIKMMADSDLNELLLMQEKEIFDTESRDFARELYIQTIEEETSAEDMAKKAEEAHRLKYWYFYEY